MKLINDVMAKAAAVSTKVKINSPKITLITGIGCGAASLYFAFRAGKKIDEMIDVNRQQIANIKDCKESGEYVDENGEIVEFTEADYRRELTSSYISYAGDIAKLAVPPLAFFTLATGCSVKNYKDSVKTIAGLTALCSSTKECFDQYRANVIKDGGVELDHKYYYGLVDKENVEVEETKTVTNKKGESKEVTKRSVKKIDLVTDVNNIASMYAVRLDLCKGFTKDYQYNVMFLESVQDMANIKLHNKGMLTLFEVYEALGVVGWIDPETELASHEVGWIMGHGDNDIKFNLVTVPTACGIKEGNVHNFNEEILVDFNCVGCLRKYIDPNYESINHKKQGVRILNTLKQYVND